MQGQDQARPHRVAVISAGGWCEGTLSRVGPSADSRLFDVLRGAIGQGLTLRNAKSDRFGVSSELRVGGAYIEAVVDLENNVRPNRQFMAARGLIPIHALTAGGAVIDGDLVIPMGGGLPDVTGDPSTDLRIVTDASVKTIGGRSIEHATLLLSLRHLVYFGKQDGPPALDRSDLIG